MVVGDPSVFAIESSITQPYPSPGHRALGFFVLHVDGESYGVRAPDATLLACSFDAVGRRVIRRGCHQAVFGARSSAIEIADAVVGALYEEARQNEFFFGMSASELRTVLASSEIVWAPDGDEAFDDGGHVLQLDLGDEVRLIAFKNRPTADDSFSSLREVRMTAKVFYGLLSEWYSRFETEWRQALKSAKH